MKRMGAWAAALLLALTLPGMGLAEAAEKEPMEPVYTFDLTVNGKHEATVAPGDVITVVFTITRTDEDEDAGYTMYSMQNEIEYDETFVMPVENGCITQPGIDTTDIALRGHGRAFYMNYLSFVDGSPWQDNQLVGTFQLQITGESGVTELNNRNFCVTKPGAQEGYEANSGDLLLYVSDQCTVRFETNGGTALEDATVLYGETLPQPQDPVKSGWHLQGWYTDYDLTQRWDFETRPVGKNMVLYAAWAQGDPEKVDLLEEAPSSAPVEKPASRVRIAFDAGGGKPVEDLWVEQGVAVDTLPVPIRAGYRFRGWFRDPACREEFQAGEIPQDKKTTLYAGWEKN